MGVGSDGCVVAGHSLGCLQTPQNVTVVLGVNSLTLRDEFIVRNPVNVKENVQHTPPVLQASSTDRLIT